MQCEAIIPEHEEHRQYEDADGLVYSNPLVPAARCPFEAARGERRCEAHRTEAMRAA